MPGNWPARFLGEGAAATSSPYPTTRWVSPGESHPQATLRTRRERLRSPGSQHSARRGIGELSRLISRGDWPNDHARVLRPLGSARITEHHRYYGAIRPCAPPRYSAPYVLALSGFSL